MTRSDVDLDLLESAVRGNARQELAGVRSAALARFQSAGLPTTRDEDWKYTNLAPVAEISNAWLARKTTEDELRRRATPAPEGIEAIWLEIRNGRIDDASLAAANERLGDRASLSRMSADGADTDLYMDDAVASLNAALMDDAVCIELADDATLDVPIGFLLDDETDENPSVSQVRVLINCGNNVTAEFIEFHRSAGDAGHFSSIITEMRLAEGSAARYVKVQQRAAHHVQVGRLQATLAKDARLLHASLDLGGRLVRNDVSVVLTAPGAHFGSAGLYLAENGQHIDNHICADHRVGPATSNQNYRGIASGRSRCVFNGKAVVREGADGTDAEQSNHNLLLSELAEIDTKPELEIYAEDVKCAHGATVGQLDPKSLFYLRSRGLGKEQAAQILTRAFANSILSEIPVEAVRAYVEQATDEKLDRLVEEPEE